MSTDPCDVPSGDAAIARRLKALSHPARIAILRALARQDCCSCGEIVRPMARAQSTVSQHLKILREAGLITGMADGARSAYCLDRKALADVAAMLDRLIADIDGAGADACGRSGFDEALGDRLCCRVEGDDENETQPRT